MHCASDDARPRTTELYGVRAKEIGDALKDGRGAPATMLENVLDGKGCVKTTAELLRDALRRIKPTSPKHARALAVVSKELASLVSVVEFLISREAKEMYTQRLLDNPASSVEALAMWIRELLQALSPGLAIDVCNAAISKLCTWVAGAGSLAGGSLAGGLEWLASSTAAKAFLAGLVVTATVTLVVAYTDAPAGKRSCALAGAACSIALDAGCLAVGIAVSSMGGILAFVAGLALTWGLSHEAHAVWAKSDVPRYFTIGQVWEAMKIAVGWTPRSEDTPMWIISPELDLQVQLDAPDMICPITMALMVEPCSLQGHLFERKEIVRWIKEHHINPMTREKAYMNDIRPCQEMRDLVVEMAEDFHYGRASGLSQLKTVQHCAVPVLFLRNEVIQLSTLYPEGLRSLVLPLALIFWRLCLGT